MIDVIRRKRKRLRAPRLSLKPLRRTLAILLAFSIPMILLGAGGLTWCQVNFACQDWLMKWLAP